MVMPLNVELRKAIDAIAAGHIKGPVYVGTGKFYFVPSTSMEQGGFYIVAQMQHTDKGNILRGWACGCRGFRFNQGGEESCDHIKQVQQGLDGASADVKAWTDGTSTSSPPASASKRAPRKPQTGRSSRSSQKVTTQGSTGNSSKTRASGQK